MRVLLEGSRGKSVTGDRARLAWFRGGRLKHYRFSAWFERLEPVAYGPLALKPHEIDEMTPGELLKMHAGYTWRLTHPAPEAVWLVAQIANMFGNSELPPWTAETLLGMKPTQAHG